MDLLIEVDNTKLHYCRADVRAEERNPVARIWSLGWTCIGSPEGKHWTGAQHTLAVLCLPETLISV